MNSKTNIVRAILLDATECDRPETDHPATIEICADDLQRILERHITEPTRCLHQIAEPSEAPHVAGDFGLTALKQYLKECEENQIVPDVGGAFAYAWQRAAAPQAVQAAVPLPMLVRDIARDLGITVPEACIALKPLGNFSTNSAVTAEMARTLRAHLRAAPAHPAEGVPAPVAAQASPTFMTADQGRDWAWNDLREDVGTEGWTVTDSVNYHGFFMHGWNYRGQYELQRAAAVAALKQELTAAPVAVVEREAFEGVASDNGEWPKAVERDAQGNYRLAQTASGWRWWQDAWRARAALAATQPAAQGMDAPNEWNGIESFPTCYDPIWLYCQDTNTVDGPVTPNPVYEDCGWTHWAYANAPSTAAIDAALAAQAKQGGNHG